ncbi:Chemotaxis protein CheV [Paraburkholderia caribensis MBA4]|uniref:Chemotaxis protein CheV n=1 Tax=Paraburkholderia caribensis MBA4 TaxID=1323664 RepID=A0A0P0RK48_9BURK|nr:chemotaxis protein [Paraburkholderia caribensis]ALL68950.1 Chemotaxis protein CheV [Paraburkholderia caribensis MBA4]
MGTAYTNDEIEKRTNLTSHNLFELLLFRLTRPAEDAPVELYGINVFKVREITMMPTIVPVASGHRHLLGMADIRGQIIPVIDLAAAAGCTSTSGTARTLIITEYSRSTQGFAVEEVDEIVRLDWKHVLSAESYVGGKTITSIARLDGNSENSRLAQVLDVEQILRDVLPSTAEDVIQSRIGDRITLGPSAKILAADDSPLARALLTQILEALEVPFEVVKSGQEAWDFLQTTAKVADAQGKRASDLIPLVISDLEMPEMDGFTLTRMIKSDPALASIDVIIHSSLTGEANEQHAKKAGANAYVAKFVANELADVIRRFTRPEQVSL